MSQSPDLTETANPSPLSDSSPSRWRRLAALVAVLLFAASFRAVLIDRPFSHNPEGVGAFYGQLARNYLRYPLSETHGVPVMTIGRIDGVAPTFYGHHPPLLPLMIAGIYSLFGTGEWQTRLVTSLFTVGCVALLYGMLTARGRPRAGLFAAAIFAAMPITLFYGGQPDVVGTPLIFFILLTIAAYTRFHDRPTVGRLILLCLAFIPAGFIDWPAYYAIPILLGHFLFTRRRADGERTANDLRSIVLMVLFCALGTTCFAAAYLHIVLGAHMPWDWIVKEVQRRSDAGEGDRGVVTLSMWLAGVWRHNLGRHTFIVLAAAFAWLIAFAFRRGNHPAATTVRLVLAWAALHILIGRQGVYVHDWWWWPLTPGLAMAAGLLIDALTSAPAMPRATPRQVHIALATAYIAFAAWTSATILPRYFEARYTRGGVDFTTVDFGEAIRVASPHDRNAPVLIAYNDTYDLPLWYYGDRPLRFDVWDSYTLAKTLADRTNTLPFGYTQPNWPTPPVGFVFPKQFIKSAPDFVADLRKRYPELQTPHFLIFDLEHVK